METNKFKTVSLDTMIDKHIGKVGTERRDAFENELRIDLLGQAISIRLSKYIFYNFWKLLGSNSESLLIG